MRVSDIKAGMMTGECKCERTFVEISAKSVGLLHVLRRGGGGHLTRNFRAFMNMKIKGLFQIRSQDPDLFASKSRTN